MEQKNIKTTVFTTETIFKDSAEIPIDVDFNLPEYCPQISKILKCKAAARISSKNIGNRSVSADGSVTVTVIYSDDENTISSYEYQYPFSKTFEAGIDLSSAMLNVKTKCEYLNCRAVTGRKIDIHGAVSVSVCVSARRGKDVICDIDDNSIEVLRQTVPATMPVCQAEKYIVIEEEIELGNSKPDIQCLIRYDTAVSVGECKLLAGKGIVKGDIAVSVLYRSVTGELQTLKSTIPFSQLLEMEGVGEECECEAGAYIAYLEIKPKFAPSGEARGFTVDGKLLLSVESYCNNDVEVITDAYSRKYEAQILNETVSLNKLVCTIHDTFNCRQELEFPEGSLCEIKDLWCDIKTDNVKFEGECLVILGTANANIIACDKSGVPSCFERPIEFSYRYNLSSDTDNLRADPQISIISSNYTLSSDNCIEIRLELSVNTAVYECKELPLISDVQVNETKPVDRSGRCAMTIYFAEAGENIWNIARRYLADINEVKRLNDIENDDLSQNKMILIPV